MRQATYQLTLQLAQKSGPIGACLRKAIKGSRIDVRAAIRALEEAEYRVEFTPGSHGSWCRAYRGDELKAQGFSGLGEDDAALQALYGAVREENAAIVISEELATLPVAIRSQIKPEARQKLESAYILRGLDEVRMMLGKK